MAVHIIDQSKAIAADFRHRALRHHAEGIFMLETVFGPTLTLSGGKVIPTRWVGEQHIKEDLGYIPILVTDACGAGHEEAGQRAISTLRFLGDALFTTTREICSILQQR